MINLIKSINYGARRNVVNWITIFTMLYLPVIVLLFGGAFSNDSLQKMTPSAYFATQELGMIFMFLSYGTIILACNLVAGDASDKTINYEFLAGHDRNGIFAARMLTGLFWGAGMTFLAMILPLGYLNLLYGWGLETDQGDVLLRCLLVLFPIIRFCALNMMLASNARSAGKGIAIGYAVYMIVALVTSILQDLFNLEFIYPTSMTNAASLLIATNSRNVVMNGKTVTLYDTAVTGEMIWKTIVISLLFTGIYLSIAYFNFKKKDRD